ncbi:MAG: AMP-binding protein, partial [Actinobacteria bacterium]|nr:AMP-binding protein [Actinomycetota bacterium]
TVRHAVWGGGAISEGLYGALRKKGLRPIGCYGSTETVGNVCFTEPSDDERALIAGNIGRPDPAYDVRLDADTGELLVRSPHPFLGYLGQPEATREVLVDGWLRTGDVAEERADGSFVLVGRRHEMYKSGGYNVYPREVELALEQHPLVQAAAVLAVPDELYGEVGHAFVIAPGADSADILADARRRLAAFKLPKRITVVDALPLLPVGKVDKATLRLQLQGAVL